MRRLAWRNERSLYKRTCDLCKNDVIAIYSADKPFTVYCPSCFYSDNWDPQSYGRDYDFSKPFFVQYRELLERTPQIALFQINMLNSPWCNYELDDKNCYLNFGGQYNEDGAYSQYSHTSKEVLDSYWLQKGELGYESVLSEGFYKIWYSILCYGCRDTYFSFDCRNSSNIFGCSGLRNKQYCIFNKQVSKDEYENFIKETITGSHTKLEEIKKQVTEFWRSCPRRAVIINKSANCSGSLIDESKNCGAGVLAEKVEDSKNIVFVINAKDCMDTTSVWGGELLYDVMGGAEQISNIKFSIGTIGGCTNIEYSYFSQGNHNCFGCSNLRHQEYCILNRQYSKEEYEALLPKIKQHMQEMPYVDSAGREYKYGEFFPVDLSSFAYNETVAYEYFPMSKEAAAQAGLAWHDVDTSAYKFSDYAIPDNIHDVGDDILEKVLKCEVSGKAYRLTPQELAFYRRFNLPIPRLSPFERHKLRLQFIKGQFQSFSRACSKDGISLNSVYTESDFPLVYCESCYQAEIV